jgi:hypothetical protein
MEVPELWCPEGEGRLVRNETNGVHFTCDVCHGYAISIWLLDELLVDGAGAALWRASAGAARNGSACPSCRKPMAAVEPVEICRDCELVWVSRAASDRLPVRPELRATGPAAPGETHCPNCGAVYTESDGDRCRYCRAEIPVSHVAVSGPALAGDTADAHIATWRPDPKDDWVGDFIEREGEV